MAEKKRKNDTESTYITLRDRILNLEYKPGRGLSTASLSNELEVSRSPVREALLRLSLENLVEIFPKSGSRVSLIDLDKVTEERFLRKSLETAAVIDFMRSNPIPYLDKMKESVELQEDAWEKQDIVKFIHFDDLFHGYIFEGISKYSCWELITSHSPNEHRLRLLSSWTIKGTTNSVIGNHQDLIKALEQKDRDEVLSIENQHLSKISEESAKLVAVYPSIFKIDVPWGRIPGKTKTDSANIRSYKNGNENFLRSLSLDI